MLNETFPLSLAPTGMVPNRSMTPHVPLSPQELARDVALCVPIGISSVHIHARNSEGEPTWSRDEYARLVGAVKDVEPTMVINVSTSGRNWSEIEKRADCLSLDGDLKPDIASLTLSSQNFMKGPSINSPDDIRELARIMLERGITPELEVFDLGMVNAIHVMKSDGLLPNLPLVNVFVGNIYGAQATALEMGVMVNALPNNSIWSGAGLGVFQASAQMLALAMGGGVRTGLEDSIFLDVKKTVLATNADLVTRVSEMASCLGKRAMSPDEFRKAALLGT